MATIQETLKSALEHHQAGRLQEAEALYRQILQVQPNHPDTLHLLGVLAHQVGKHQVAVDYITRAIALNPAAAEYHSSVGEAYRALARLNEAEASYKQALALKPAYAEVCNNLGIVLQEQGKLQEAEVYYKKAVAISLSYADAYNNLGVALKKQGKLKEAVAQYRQALALQPTSAQACNNLGNALKDLGKLDEAIECFGQALTLKPDYAEAHNNLGNALKEQGKLEEAVTQYRRALTFKPVYADAFYNLGNVLQTQGLLSEAVAYYRRALALEPTYAGAYNNLGNALRDQGKPEEAEASFRRALALKPDDAVMHSNLLFALNYHRADAAAVAKGYREWNDRHARPLAAHSRVHRNDQNPGRRLRVGYVSADFREHAISYFFEPLLAAHDREHVEVFCYSSGTRADGTTKRLRTLTDVWRDVGELSDDAMAKCISSDKIDILVDLSGHTAGNRLLVFARKPAPVQVTYLGSLTTTGLTTMDYRLTDRYLTPPRSPEWFSEKLIRLPNCFACYRPPEGAPAVASLPMSVNGHVTFGSFNNLAKVTPDVVALWSNILRGLPKARLILKSKTLADPEQRARYQGLFTANGVKDECVELHPWTSVPDFLTQYGHIDIALDPFPYNGCTTTCEALWMGVPVITLAGSMSYGRFGVSLLSNLGLEEFIATAPADYVKKAVSWAKNRKCLAELRSQLRPQMVASALCDTKAFASGVEQAYRQMWRRWCRS